MHRHVVSGSNRQQTRAIHHHNHTPSHNHPPRPPNGHRSHGDPAPTWYDAARLRRAADTPLPDDDCPYRGDLSGDGIKHQTGKRKRSSSSLMSRNHTVSPDDAGPRNGKVTEVTEATDATDATATAVVQLCIALSSLLTLGLMMVFLERFV